MELPLPLDANRFRGHFERLIESARCEEGGIEQWLAALAGKHHLYRTATERAGRELLSLDEVEMLLAQAFTARRWLYPALAALGTERVSGLIAGLDNARVPLVQRIQNFVDAMAGADGPDRESLRAAARVRRASWDFAAELLHFSRPERYPLMTRWVWDRTTQSGALREFVQGGDGVSEIPFDNSPELFEAARRWLASEIAGEGIYRDVPLWIDLTLAQAYVAYVRSMAEGGLGSDFARGVQAHEQLKKLLGIDARGGHARARVRKTA